MCNATKLTTEWQRWVNCNSFEMDQLLDFSSGDPPIPDATDRTITILGKLRA
jgi:hypothetical protein